MVQHTHSSTPFNLQLNPVTLLCDNIMGPANIGGLFRISDAFGVSEIVFCRTNPDISSNRLRKTSRNTEKRVSFRFSENTMDEIESFTSKGYQLLALEICSNSIPLEKMKVDTTKHSVLVLGNEQHGISEKILDKVDQVLHIEMFGGNSSMNVVQATAIALYELNRHYR